MRNRFEYCFGYTLSIKIDQREKLKTVEISLQIYV